MSRSRGSSERSGSHRQRGFLSRLTGTVFKAGALCAGVGLWALAPRTQAGRRRDAVSAYPLEGLPKGHTHQIPMPNVPYAHRGLHDAGSGLRGGANSEENEKYVALARRMARKAGYTAPAGRPEAPIAPENSLAAFAAACEAGYGIELDLQLTADGQVVVVHDSNLKRVTGIDVRVQDLTYDQLREIALFPSPSKAGDGRSATPAGASGRGAITSLKSGVPVDAAGSAVAGTGAQADADSASVQHVPLFRDVLRVVDGRVPIIVEYKFDGRDYREELMEKGDRILRGYRGPYVVESFDPRVVRWYRLNEPSCCRGQLATEADFPSLDQLRGRAKESDALSGPVPGIDMSGLARYAAGNLLFDWYGRPDFVALDWTMGGSPQARLARKMGAILVAWTVRNPAEEFECTDRFDRVIFEAYIPRTL